MSFGWAIHRGDVVNGFGRRITGLILVVGTILSGASYSAVRRESARGTYGQDPTQEYPGSTAIYVDANNKSILQVTWSVRCMSNWSDCVNNGAFAPTATYAFFYDVVFLNPVNQLVDLYVDAPFDPTNDPSLTIGPIGYIDLSGRTEVSSLAGCAALPVTDAGFSCDPNTTCSCIAAVVSRPEGEPDFSSPLHFAFDPSQLVGPANEFLTSDELLLVAESHTPPDCSFESHDRYSLRLPSKWRTAERPSGGGAVESPEPGCLRAVCITADSRGNPNRSVKPQRRLSRVYPTSDRLLLCSGKPGDVGWRSAKRDHVLC